MFWKNFRHRWHLPIRTRVRVDMMQDYVKHVDMAFAERCASERNCQLALKYLHRLDQIRCCLFLRRCRALVGL